MTLALGDGEDPASRGKLMDGPLAGPGLMRKADFCQQRSALLRWPIPLHHSALISVINRRSGADRQHHLLLPIRLLQNQRCSVSTGLPRCWRIAELGEQSKPHCIRPFAFGRQCLP